MRAAVNAWAHSFLIQHASIVKYRSSANLLRGRFGLLTWSSSHCVFCGKKTSHRAIFANALGCCTTCDRAVWPNKVSQTNAKTQYALKESDLFQGLDAAGGRVATSGLQHGTYTDWGKPVTVFLQDQLQTLADRLHGPGWQARRTDKLVRRRAKRAQRQHIEFEMQRKRTALNLWHPDDWCELWPGENEEWLDDAPEGWSELSRAVRKELLGDLPSYWFELTLEEKKEEVAELWDLRMESDDMDRRAERMIRIDKEYDRWLRSFHREQEIEHRISEQDVAMELELLSNEPPGWFEMTSAERQERFAIRKLDVDLERRISKQEQEAEWELFGNEPPGWFEMTSVEREELFVIKAVV